MPPNPLMASIATDLQRFRYTFDEPRETSKPNGKPLLRGNDYGLPAFETGFDVANVDGNPEKCLMVCSICLCVPRYPIELRRCGHVFCFLCILRNLNFASPSSGALCPNCKRSYLMSSIIEFNRTSQALQNIYNGFDVHCVYGCGHVCSPTAMLEHETWACPQRPVGCINEGCGRLLPDLEMEAHLEVCAKRSIYCYNCFLPQRFDGVGHNCLQSSRETIRGMPNFFKFLNFLRCIKQLKNFS